MLSPKYKFNGEGIGPNGSYCNLLIYYFSSGCNMWYQRIEELKDTEKPQETQSPSLGEELQAPQPECMPRKRKSEVAGDHDDPSSFRRVRLKYQIDRKTKESKGTKLQETPLGLSATHFVYCPKCAAVFRGDCKSTRRNLRRHMRKSHDVVVPRSFSARRQSLPEHYPSYTLDKFNQTCKAAS